MPVSVKKVWKATCICGGDIRILTSTDQKVAWGECRGCRKVLPQDFKVTMTMMWEATMEDINGNYICSVIAAKEDEVIWKAEELAEKLKS